jgi:hypothetical protein
VFPCRADRQSAAITTWPATTHEAKDAKQMNRTRITLGKALSLGLGTAALALSLSACSSSSSPPPTGTALTSKATPIHKSAPHIAGQITTQNGSIWTLVTGKGHTYTVTLTDTTKFGTKIHPATREQFTIGNQARVTGTISGRTITATRISVPHTPAPPAAALGATTN